MTIGPWITPVWLLALTLTAVGQSPNYHDGRPAAPLRMEAKDHGVVLRHGDGPGNCDILGARDVWMFEHQGTYYMHYDAGPSQDSSNLSLGGFVQYQFPRLDRLGVGANLFYAPSVLSFGDSDDFYEVGTWVGYQIIRDAEVYLGWRRIGSDLDQGGDTVVDTGIHIGLRARF